MTKPRKPDSIHEPQAAGIVSVMTPCLKMGRMHRLAQEETHDQ
jgi:hypothetical protein